MSYWPPLRNTCGCFLIAARRAPRNHARGARFPGKEQTAVSHLQKKTAGTFLSRRPSLRALWATDCKRLSVYTSTPNPSPCFHPVPTCYWYGRRHKTKGARGQRWLSYRVVRAEEKGHDNARINASTSTAAAVRMNVQRPKIAIDYTETRAFVPSFSAPLWKQPPPPPPSPPAPPTTPPRR